MRLLRGGLGVHGGQPGSVHGRDAGRPECLRRPDRPTPGCARRSDRWRRGLWADPAAGMHARLPCRHRPARLRSRQFRRRGVAVVPLG